MKTITEIYPPMPINDLLSRIERFEKSSLEEKFSLISELVNIHPILNQDFSGGRVFKRIRRISEDCYPEDTQDLLWRPDGIASVGRANPEGFPVLYIADRLDTALKETRINSDYVLLSELKVREGEACRVAPIGEMMHIQRTGEGYLTGSSAKVISDMINACDRKVAASLLITDSFLYDCLVKDDDDYLISSFVAKSIYDKNSDLSAIAYHSTRQYGAVNFAIRTDHFWNSWSIVAARKMHAQHLAYGYYETSQTEHVTGITRLGKLVWEKGFIEDNTSVRLDPPWFPST